MRHTPEKTLSPRYRGWTCAACQAPLADGAAVCECLDCGAPQHVDCWRRVGLCAAYACTPGASAPALHRAPDVVVSPRETADVAIQPSVAGAPFRAHYKPEFESRAAKWAFILGLLGYPLALPAIAAIFIGLGALVMHATNRRAKNLLFALCGILLGLGALGLWSIVVSFILLPAQSFPVEVEEHVVTSLDEAPEGVRRAVRAHVRFERSSACVVERDGDRVRIEPATGGAATFFDGVEATASGGWADADTDAEPAPAGKAAPGDAVLVVGGKAGEAWVYWSGRVVSVEPDGDLLISIPLPRESTGAAAFNGAGERIGEVVRPTAQGSVVRP